MLVDHELNPMAKPLYWFAGNSIVLWEGLLWQLKWAHPHFMEFLTVDHRFAYHGVLGRPALKELWAVTSIHHLRMKFPIKQGTVMVRGNQMGSRKCYLNSLQKGGALERKRDIMDIKMFDALKKSLRPNGRRH